MVLKSLFDQSIQYYKKNPQAVSDLLNDLACNQHDPNVAAMTIVANSMLNLDEVVVKE
jgi:hypothetical protein